MANSYRPAPLIRWFREFRDLLSMPLTGNRDMLPAPPCHFALIAFQRSGTHLLREILNSNPHLALMVETFSPTTKRLYWFNFLRRLPKSRFPSLTPEIAMDVLDEHMRRVRRDVQIEPEWYGGRKPHLKALGLDVKYNQLKAFNSLAINLKSRPLLLDYFKTRNFRIVHLTRNNLAHAALSLILANMRNVWHNYDASEFRGQYKVTWGMLHSHMKCIQEERDEFVRLTKDLPTLTCAYEDLVDDLSRVDESGEFPEDTTLLKPLAEFLGVPNQFVYDGKMHKVVNKPYAEILENFDDIIHELRNSEFAEFAASLETFKSRRAAAVQSRAA